MRVTERQKIILKLRVLLLLKWTLGILVFISFSRVLTFDPDFYPFVFDEPFLWATNVLYGIALLSFFCVLIIALGWFNKRESSLRSSLYELDFGWQGKIADQMKEDSNR